MKTIKAVCLVGLVVGLSAGFGMAAFIPAWKLPCNGHNHSGAGIIKKGESIAVEVYMYAGTNTPDESDWIELAKDTVADLEYVCSSAKVYIKVKASDKDTHVCEAMNPPTNEVSNYIKNTDLEVEVKSADSAFSEDLELTTSSGKTFVRIWTKTWDISDDAAGKYLTFTFSGEVDDLTCEAYDFSPSLSSVKRDHTESFDDPEYMDVFSAKLTVIKVELEQTDNNSPINPKNRMCSNADAIYSNVIYKVKVTPNTLKANLEISGSASVKFGDGTTTKNNVAHGTVVTLTATDGTTGTWNLTAESADLAGCKDEAEEYVFKMVMVPYAIAPIPEPSTAVPLGDVEPADSTTGLGYIRYTKLAYVRPEPDVAPVQNFRTLTYVDIACASVITSDFEGRTFEALAVNSGFLTSPAWGALVNLGGVCLGPGVGAVNSCLTLLIAGGGSLHNAPAYTEAGGIGKPLADFQNDPLVGSPFAIVPPMRGDGCDGLPDPSYTSLSWPFDESTLPSLPANCSVTAAYGSTGNWTGRLFVDAVYSDVRIRNELNSKFDSEAAYGWSYSHMSGNSKVYMASGVNVDDAGGAVLVIDFTQTAGWKIFATP